MSRQTPQNGAQHKVGDQRSLRQQYPAGKKPSQQCKILPGITLTRPWLKTRKMESSPKGVSLFSPSPPAGMPKTQIFMPSESARPRPVWGEKIIAILKGVSHLGEGVSPPSSPQNRSGTGIPRPTQRHPGTDYREDDHGFGGGKNLLGVSD